VAPALGRTLTQDDADVSRHALVLSHGLWQRLFGADPSVLGSTIQLDYRSFEIVGVMPEGFAYPEGEPVDVWVPLTVIPEDDIPIGLRPVRFLQMIGRLAPGASITNATVDLGEVARSLEETYPDSNAGVDAATVTPLQEWVVGDVRRSLLVTLGAVGLILLLACANVANLLLARGTARATEVALRMSLGAPSGRIVRQLLTESLLLSATGAAAGLGLAWGATRALSRSAGDLLPRATAIGLDGTVIGVSLLVGLLVSALAGVLPALRAADVAPARDLRADGRSGGGGRSAVRLRRVLVGSEVAFAVLLLTGAGLLLRSLEAMQRVDPGFEAESRIAMTITIVDMKYPTRPEWQAVYHEILDRLSAHPSVQAAGAIRYLPFRGGGEALPVRVEGLYEPTPDEQRYANLLNVSDGLFDAMGIRLLRGRGIEGTDRPGSPLVVVVNEAFQRDFFQGQDPVGRRFASSGQEIEVVGVVADVRQEGLTEEAEPTVYVSNDQIARIQMSYVVHVDGDPLAMVPEMRRIVADIDPDQPISEFVPLAELTAENLARPRFFTAIMGSFALVALLLAALGVYGVLAYTVRSRVRDTGLRLALGASASSVWRGVVAQGMAPVAVGLAVGVGASLALAGLLESLLFGVTPLDAATHLGVVAVLALVGVAACAVPAWTACRVDPMISIRAE
jgi:predicted permease